MKFSLLVFILAILSSCSGDFKKVEELGEFRLLAIVADTPEVAPGGTVSFSLFVSDVNGGERTIEGSYISCVDPGISAGAPVSCDYDPSAIAVNYDIDKSTDTNLEPGNLYTGFAQNTISLQVPAGILAGRSAADQFNGVGYIVIFNFNVDGKTVTAFKRIVATNRDVYNLNPVVDSILVNGDAGGSDLNKGDTLRVTANAPEIYDFINTQGNIESKTEVLQTAWYVSEGRFDLPKSNVNESVKFLGDTPAALSVVVSIVRDDRGGVEVVREIFP